MRIAFGKQDNEWLQDDWKAMYDVYVDGAHSGGFVVGLKNGKWAVPVGDEAGPDYQHTFRTRKAAARFLIGFSGSLE